MNDARAFTMPELAARAWWTLSPYRDERALAARRFRETAPACADEDLRLHVVSLLALEGFHARAITARVVTDRAEWLVRWGGYDGAIVQLGRDLVDDTIRRVAAALSMRRAR